MLKVCRQMKGMVIYMAQNRNRIRLPRLISDGMVLQRNAEVKIWGFAPVGEDITVSFMDRVYRTLVDTQGEWRLSIETSDAGGPYDMVIQSGDGNDTIIVKDILLGDVWLCSGQSNMEMKMLSLKEVYPVEIEKAYNNSIRQFLVPVTYHFEKPQTELENGSWESVNPQNILNFGATGYFFAVKLYEKYQIPIGLINASLGGSPAEAWLSEEGLAAFPDYLEVLTKFKNKNYEDAVLKNNDKTREDWYRNINQNDLGMVIGELPYQNPEYNASNWPTIKVPSYWSEEGLGQFNGVVWFRKDIQISRDQLKQSARLKLGNVVDGDTTYINGIKIGEIPFQYEPRIYEIPEGVLKEGSNTIVVRVVSEAGSGGFYKGKPYQLMIGDQMMDLCGEWQYSIGVKCEPMPAPVFVSWQPVGLYNGMIAPLLRYVIKGALWYQGETNAQKPDDYEELLKALIADWRKSWRLGDFPFLIVQLPNFNEPSDSPAVSHWAIIREAQRKALTVAGTGMAVTIDIGEWNDVHPVNKKDVGFRLALAAQRVAYGDQTVVAFGPLLKSAKRDKNCMILSFEETGSGLVCQGSEKPGHFAIAGEDQIFYWAEAKIEKDSVVVWHELVSDPIHVRYAWADNPEGANLYNREGLPASPFEVTI